MGEDGFISFLCPHCQTEIEATEDMIGERTECPACGGGLLVPDTRAPAPVAGPDGIVRHGQGAPDKTRGHAQKARTIRIELGDF